MTGNQSLPGVDRTVMDALVAARKIHGGKTAIVHDADKRVMTYDDLLLGASVLGRKFASVSRPGEAIALLLPNAGGAAAAFFACHATGRVPAMLNFTAGLKNLKAACAAAEMRTIVTSRRFVELGGLEDVIEGLAEDHRILWLEEVRDGLSVIDKALGAGGAFLLRSGLAKAPVRPDDPAVILFTSGTEGSPKGVVLTHRNVLANCAQVGIAVKLMPDDRIFNPLPIFHSFGLTLGLIMPLIRGLPLYLYPSPLHYKTIPPQVGTFAATVLLATDTFLQNYGRIARQDDFRTLRMAVGGAERVKVHTREIFDEKFGIPLIEGYGATEAAPVIACNAPDANKPGTVGRLVPQIEHRLEPVPGLDEGGRLFVRGPNVMAGYLRADAPGVLDKPENGWHDTGDIVVFDDDGFISIRGRAKRFAKIGGEMVSLTAVEAYVASVWPDNSHAVVALPDDRKGEQLVLVSDAADANRPDLVKWCREHGVAELMIPRSIVHVETIPVLGTGKTDYPEIQDLAYRATARVAAE